MFWFGLAEVGGEFTQIAPALVFCPLPCALLFAPRCPKTKSWLRPCCHKGSLCEYPVSDKVVRHSLAYLSVQKWLVVDAP